MIDANKGTSKEVLRRLREGSYERFRIELLKNIEQLLTDFEMTWEDLSEKLGLRRQDLREYVGMENLSAEEINAIAHVFSCEPYLIFRPRFPWTET